MRRITCVVVLSCVAAWAQGVPGAAAVGGELKPQVPTVAQVSDETARDAAAYWSSVAAHGLGVYLSIATSWKRVEPDPAFAEPAGPYAGRFYYRGAATKTAIAAAVLVPQFFLAKKYPALRKWFSYVNFSIAATYGVQSGHNLTEH